MNTPLNRPVTTLYMLASLDGKISTGSSDEFDFDKDLQALQGVKEGLHQYYEIEQTTDLWSFNTGRVLEKIGVNNKKPGSKSKSDVSFAILDNKHLSDDGIAYLCDYLKNVVILTSNPCHPAFKFACGLYKNIYVVYQPTVNFNRFFEIIKEKFRCKAITIQSGGTVNNTLFRQGLIDNIDIVIAPIIVGGKDTPSLCDGESLKTIEDLDKISTLKLKSIDKLENSYIRLRYSVNK